MGDFKTLIVFGYDPIAKEYTGTAFDNSGAFVSVTVGTSRATSGIGLGTATRAMASQRTSGAGSPTHRPDRQLI
jgi:hypothetical protein